jgi:hypothetical protein
MRIKKETALKCVLVPPIVVTLGVRYATESAIWTFLSGFLTFVVLALIFRLIYGKME